jgi:P-loop containing NTP hydrolase pore-1
VLLLCLFARHDATRDLKDIGATADKLVCFKLDELDKLTEEEKEKAIVVFVTYSLLSKKCHVKTLIQWAGGSDFEGCLLFDESHMVRVVVLPVVRSRFSKRHIIRMCLVIAR